MDVLDGVSSVLWISALLALVASSARAIVLIIAWKSIVRSAMGCRTYSRFWNTRVYTSIVIIVLLVPPVVMARA